MQVIPQLVVEVLTSVPCALLTVRSGIQVIQCMFSDAQKIGIERELTRVRGYDGYGWSHVVCQVLSSCDFSLEHSVHLQIKRKSMQRSAAQMLELTTVS